MGRGGGGGFSKLFFNWLYNYKSALPITNRLSFVKSLNQSDDDLTVKDSRYETLRAKLFSLLRCCVKWPTYSLFTDLNILREIVEFGIEIKFAV